MNCPYCNEELKPIVGACEDTEYYCQNCDYMTGDEKLWEQLTKYKQALDITVDVLKEIDKLLSLNKFDVRELPLLNITQTKISMLLNFINIKQIKALTKGGNNE